MSYWFDAAYPKHPDRPAWYQRATPTRCIYIVNPHDGRERRLWTGKGTPLGQVLVAALENLGYDGPADGDEE